MGRNTFFDTDPAPVKAPQPPIPAQSHAPAVAKADPQAGQPAIRVFTDDELRQAARQMAAKGGRNKAKKKNLAPESASISAPQN